MQITKGGLKKGAEYSLAIETRHLSALVQKKRARI